MPSRAEWGQGSSQQADSSCTGTAGGWTSADSILSLIMIHYVSGPSPTYENSLDNFGLSF